MRKLSVLILSLVFSVTSLLAAPALPKLAEDPSITRGVLPDGLAYILVANPGVKGVADIAILQRACQTQEEVPAAFLARKCVGPGRDGFIQRKEDNLIYRFDNFPVAGGDSYVDSLLLSMIYIVDKSASRGEPAYGTTNQTLIIAGDIDRKAITSKLKLLSLFVPKSVSEAPVYNYMWEPGERLSTEVTEGEGAARIRFEYRLPAMPPETHNTVASVVSDQFADIFNTLLTSSVRRYFRLNSIQDGKVGFVRERPDTRIGDDVYILDVEVPQDKVEATVRSISSMLSKMVAKGVSRDEYDWAYRKYKYEKAASLSKPVSNREYVDKCINAVLYNASLATETEKYNFFANKDIPDTTRLRHFNRFAASLGTSSRRLTVSVDGAPSGMDADSLRSILKAGASLGCSLVDVNDSDTLGFPAPQEKKFKKPSVKKDVITGGQFYMYANGINMVYKKMATNGVFHYSWMLHGGSDTPVDLRSGNVSYLSGDSFMNLLEANGITAQVRTSAKGIAIEGRFDTYKLMLFLKSMQMLFEAHPEFGSPSAGLLVLVGDRTEYSVEKIFQVMVGNFKTDGPARANTQCNDVWELDRKDGSILYQSIYQVDFLYSAENMMTARVAKMVVEDALIDVFVGTGCCAEVRGAFVTSPRDMYTLDIKVCHVDGMEMTITESAARTKVKDVLAELSRNPYSKEKIAIAKTLLSGSIAKAQATPEYWLTAARMRFAESKDMVSKYADKVNQVTPEKVCSLIKTIAADGPDELFKSAE